MSKIRSVKGQTTVRGFKKAVRSQGGWAETGGRHPKLCHPNGGRAPYTQHGNDMKRGTARGLSQLLMALGFLVFVCGVPVFLSLVPPGLFGK